MTRLQRVLAMGVTMGMLVSGALAQIRPPLDTKRKPTLNPNAVAEAKVEAQTVKLLDYLETEYGKLWDKNRDRVSRSLIAISLARLPRETVSSTLLDALKTQSDPLIRAVVWECLIARCKLLTQDGYRRVLDATETMLGQNQIRGGLRAAACNLLACSEPSKRNKDMFLKIFNMVDSRQPQDDEVIDALGRVIEAWKSPDLIEALINKTTNVDEAWRAQRVLAAGGVPVGTDQIPFDKGDAEALRGLQTALVKWWNGARGSWQETKVSLEDKPWTKMPAHIIPSPEDYKAFNFQDPRWRRDMELKAPNLRSFDVGLVVDATGSMGPALAWLHRDVKRILAGVGVVCLEPRIGITFYRDPGDAFVVQHHPLTDRIEILLSALEKMTAKGGGDLPEDVLDGMKEAWNNNRWSGSSSSRKVMVIIGDAPSHPEQQKDCETLATEAAAKGLRTMVIKLNGQYAAPDTSGLDAIANAGKGIILDGSMQELQDAAPRKNAREILSRPPRYNSTWDSGGSSGGGVIQSGSSFKLGGSTANIPAPSATPPAQPEGGNFVPGAGPTGRRLLAALVAEAVNPQYADRVDPMVAVLWELLQEPTTEKQEKFGPVVVRDMTRNHERGEHMNEKKPPAKPFDPQAR